MPRLTFARRVTLKELTLGGFVVHMCAMVVNYDVIMTK